MSLLRDIDDMDANGKKGDWCFLNNDTLLCLRWGDGFAEVAMLYVADPGDGIKHQVWQWDGNKEAPTLSPSILSHTKRDGVDVTLWHGYLREGKLVEA